jgi:hypothetical protein
VLTANCVIVVFEIVGVFELESRGRDEAIEFAKSVSESG